MRVCACVCVHGGVSVCVRMSVDFVTVSMYTDIY